MLVMFVLVDGGVGVGGVSAGGVGVGIGVGVSVGFGIGADFGVGVVEILGALLSGNCGMKRNTHPTQQARECFHVGMFLCQGAKRFGR